MNSILKNRNTQWLLGAWTIYIFTFSIQILGLSRSPLHSDEGQYLLTNIFAGLITGWGLIVFYLMPINKLIAPKKMSSRIIILLFCGVIFCFLYILSTILIQALLLDHFEYAWLEEQFIFYARFNFHNTFKNYFFLSILLFALDYYQRKNMLAQQEAELRTRLVQMELQNLKSQFQPHFLFNALNSVIGVLDSRNHKAENMLLQLSDILRVSINNEFDKEHTLKEELELAEKLLSIEKVRYDEQLQYAIKVDEELMQTKVPILITQPIIENAIKHGFKYNNNQELTINITSSNNEYLRIANNGTLLEQINFNKGLSGIEERLQVLYGGDKTFRIYQSDNWVVNEIKL